MLRTIGLMSGTSLDGVDAAFVETDGERIGRLGRSLTMPYDAALRADLRRLLNLAPTLAPDDAFLADVTHRLTARHAEAVAALGEPAELIGFHGQTILHDPARRRTWQIGDAAWLARATGTPVAHDFRSADVAAGGQGAPFAPAFHAALAAGLERPLAVLNIGGVANVTFWSGGDEIAAFDTGPGNGMIDLLVQSRDAGRFDEEGRLARAGRVDEAVLGALLDHPYFRSPPPKSLDRHDFSLAPLQSLSLEDSAATLVAFTAEAVRLGFKLMGAAPRELVVAGGGRLNPQIMKALRERLPTRVSTAEDHGWRGDAIEAEAFAYLAARTARGLPISFPQTTGVAHPMTGGRIVRPGVGGGAPA